MIFAEQAVRFSAVGLGLLYGGTKLGYLKVSLRAEFGAEHVSLSTSHLQTWLSTTAHS